MSTARGMAVKGFKLASEKPANQDLHCFKKICSSVKLPLWPLYQCHCFGPLNISP